MIHRWLAIYLLVIGGAAVAQENARTLSVTGTGAVAVKPDQATIAVGVETDARRAAEALEVNSALMGQVLAALADAGVADQDVQTTALTLHPQYDNRSSGQGIGIARYVARNMLTIRVRRIDDLGPVLDAVNDAGANAIHSIQFGVSDPEPHRDAARQAAVRDATRKAALLAEAAGVALGPLMVLTEGGATRPQPMAMARAESMAMDVPIAEGEVSLSATVHLVFAIE